MSPEKMLQFDKEHSELVLEWFDKAIGNVRFWRRINNFHHRAGIDDPDYRTEMSLDVDEILHHLTAKQRKKSGV